MECRLIGLKVRKRGALNGYVPEMKTTCHLLDGLTVHVVGDLQIRQPLLGHDGVPVAPQGPQDEATPPPHHQLAAAPAHRVRMEFLGLHLGNREKRHLDVATWQITDCMQLLDPGLQSLTAFRLHHTVGIPRMVSLLIQTSDKVGMNFSYYERSSPQTWQQ